MLAYHARYFELDFVSVGDAKDSVEPWFSLPLLDPSGREIKGWRLNGKRDAIKHFAADKRTKTVEHKTTSCTRTPPTTGRRRDEHAGHIYIDFAAASRPRTPIVLATTSRASPARSRCSPRPRTNAK